MPPELGYQGGACVSVARSVQAPAERRRQVVLFDIEQRCSDRLLAPVELCGRFANETQEEAGVAVSRGVVLPVVLQRARRIARWTRAGGIER